MRGQRKRVDVIPVTLWDPPEHLAERLQEADTGVWIVGSVQRRFWQGQEGRRSRLEIAAA